MPRNASTGEVGPNRVPAVAAPLKTRDTSEGGYDPADVPETDVVDETISDDDVTLYGPTDKIPDGEIVYVRNNTNSVVRFVDSPKPGEAKFNIVLQPAGQDDSVISLESLTVLRNPGFQRWWKNGKMTVAASPIVPKRVDIGQLEIERHQQFQLNGTLEKTAPGSLPLHNQIDFSFLDQYNPKSPKYKG